MGDSIINVYYNMYYDKVTTPKRARVIAKRFYHAGMAVLPLPKVGLDDRVFQNNRFYLFFSSN